VTLTLGRLQAERFIQVRRRQIVVLSRDRLAAEAATAGQTPVDMKPRTGKACDCNAGSRK
jgi:hypothetical protein